MRRWFSHSHLRLRFIDLLTSANLKPRLSPRSRRLEHEPKRGKVFTEKPSLAAAATGETPQSTGVGDEGKEKSKHQKFRELPYSPTVLESIEKEKLGKVQRIRVAKFMENSKDDPNLPEDWDAAALMVRN